MGAGLRGELNTYFPRLLEGKTLGDPTECNKIVTIFLMSKVNRGRTSMAVGIEKGKGLCWVRVATRLLVREVPLGWPGLSTGKKQRQLLLLQSFKQVFPPCRYARQPIAQWVTGKTCSCCRGLGPWSVKIPGQGSNQTDGRQDKSKDLESPRAGCQPRLVF